MMMIELTLNHASIQILHKAVSDAYMNWSGGHPEEQVQLEKLRNDLYKCLLEFQLQQ